MSATVTIAGVYFDNINGRVTGFDGWYDTPKPDAQLVHAGGADGAVAAGTWRLAEQYLTLVAEYRAESDEMFAAIRAQLITGLPPDRESPIYVRTANGDQRIIWVRPYDAFTFQRQAGVLVCTLPLVAPDPYRYGWSSVSATMGVYTSDSFYRQYVTDTVPVPPQLYRDYVTDTTVTPNELYRTYLRVFDGTSLPAAADLTNPGDALTRRVTIDVVGPLVAGDWWLHNETTNERLDVDLTLAAGETLTLDTLQRTATLGGVTVFGQTFGDWITLAPGQNRVRLRSGTLNDTAYARLYAFPAYH